MDNQTQIIVRHENGAYTVSVEPAHPKYPVQIFDNLKSARGASGGIRLATRWPRLDLTAEGVQHG